MRVVPEEYGTCFEDRQRGTVPSSSKLNAPVEAGSARALSRGRGRRDRQDRAFARDGRVHRSAGASCPRAPRVASMIFS